MAWYLKVSTDKGDHQLDFADEASAQAALDEAMSAMQQATVMDPTVVKIAGRLVLTDAEINSANIWEAL